MLQPTHCNNVRDTEGNPAGGTAKGLGIEITWQDGSLGFPPDQAKVNGAFVEGVLSVSLARLLFLNTGKFFCRENAIAITKIEEALHWLGHRQAERMMRQVEDQP